MADLLEFSEARPVNLDMTGAFTEKLLQDGTKGENELKELLYLAKCVETLSPQMTKRHAFRSQLLSQG